MGSDKSIHKFKHNTKKRQTIFLV